MKYCVCYIIAVCRITILMLLLVSIHAETLLSQRNEQGEIILGSNAPSPQFQYARNMAIINQLTGGARASIKSKEETLVFETYLDSIRLSIIDTFDNITRYGAIAFNSNMIQLRDICSLRYGDSTVCLFIAFKSSIGTTIYSIRLDTTNLEKIHGKTTDILTLTGNTTQQIPDLHKVEQITIIDSHLFIATDTDTLIHYDVSGKVLGPSKGLRISFPAPTLHVGSENMKIHEVKGYRASNGQRIVGLGWPRRGICLITFTSDVAWDTAAVQFQYYEHDRSLFPGTIINPNKCYFDTTFISDSSSERNHKWDWNQCHSVLPR
jgi:hypothetical protein